jgi:predicted nucleic acid-binding protein
VAVDVDAELAVSAGALAQLHALSGADAVQLAAAVSVSTDDLVFVSWDGRLTAGALAAGIAVVPTTP